MGINCTCSFFQPIVHHVRPVHSTPALYPMKPLMKKNRGIRNDMNTSLMYDDSIPNVKSITRERTTKIMVKLRRASIHSTRLYLYKFIM